MRGRHILPKGGQQGIEREGDIYRERGRERARDRLGEREVDRERASSVVRTRWTKGINRETEKHRDIERDRKRERER